MRPKTPTLNKADISELIGSLRNVAVTLASPAEAADHIANAYQRLSLTESQALRALDSLTSQFADEVITQLEAKSILRRQELVEILKRANKKILNAYLHNTGLEQLQPNEDAVRAVDTDAAAHAAEYMIETGLNLPVAGVALVRRTADISIAMLEGFDALAEQETEPSKPKRFKQRKPRSR